MKNISTLFKTSFWCSITTKYEGQLSFGGLCVRVFLSLSCSTQPLVPQLVWFSQVTSCKDRAVTLAATKAINIFLWSPRMQDLLSQHNLIYPFLFQDPKLLSLWDEVLLFRLFISLIFFPTCKLSRGELELSTAQLWEGSAGGNPACDIKGIHWLLPGYQVGHPLPALSAKSLFIIILTEVYYFSGIDNDKGAISE